MKQRDITKIFRNEIYIKPPEKNYETNKTIVKHVDDCWGIDLLDMIDYGVSNNKGYRYIQTIIDNFSKFAWTTPLKNKYAQTIEDDFANIIKESKHKPHLLESDNGKEFVNK